MEKRLAAAKQKTIKILLVAVPFKQQLGMDAIGSVEVNNYLEATYVDGTDVRLLDMNRMRRELDFGYPDLLNEGHVNGAGAKKVTACLADFILENYDTAVWEG